MKNFLQSFTKQNLQMITRTMIVLVALGFLGSPAYSQITGTTPASRCGEGTLTLHATASSGTITWFTVPFYGSPVGTGATFVTPSLSVTATYFVDALDANGCSLNTNQSRWPVIATISANTIQAIIFYSSSTYCNSLSTPQPVTQTGTAGGTYTYTLQGQTSPVYTTPSAGPLSIDVNGAILPSASTNGTYTITYTVVPAPGCVENPASTDVTITTAPLPSSISYTGSPFCTTLSSVPVNLTNPNGGTFSASPAGLDINSVSGTVLPAGSLGGTYTVTYFVSGAGGCAPQAPTTMVTITALPTAAILYAGAPFCKDISTTQTPGLTGTGAYTGGTYGYTGPGTLTSFNTGTGAFTPSTSGAGTYTVTYTAPASGNCSSVAVTTSVTINILPTASISGDASVCQNATSPNITFTGLTGTAPFTFTYNVNGGGPQTISTTSGSSVNVAQPTVSAGTYIYTLTGVSDAHGCAQAASGTATITVTATPVATFVYAGSPYCKTGTAVPTFTGGGTAGIFSGTGVVFVSTATGEINLVSTPAGTYTITNTISACGGVSSTAPITITALPTASITGTLTACGMTTLTVTTNAASPVYIWYKDNVVIPDQTASTLVVTASGAYKVKVTDGSTFCEFTSAASTVVITPIPTASISGTFTACVTTTLTAVSDAISPSYIWYMKDISDVYQVIPGQTNSTLVVTGSGFYKVKITKAGCENTSDPAFVTIDPATVAGNVTGGQTVCTGGNSTLLTLTGYTGSIVRWESSVSPFSTWTPITNTIATYTATGLTATTEFRAVVQSGVCIALESGATTITVVADPTWNTYSFPATSICNGGSVTFSATVSGGSGGSVSWMRNDNVNPLSGTDVLVTSPDSPIIGTWYYRPVYNPTVSGCNLSDGTQTTVTVVADPTWDTYTFPTTTICIGGSVTFSATVSGGVGGSVSWIRSNNATPGAGTEIPVTSPDSPITGTWYYRPVYNPTVSGCNLTDGTQTAVTVKSITDAPVITSPICVGATTVSGTSESGASVTVYVNGLNPVTVTATGTAWTATVSALSSGNAITAFATASGKCISLVSNSVTVATTAAPVVSSPILVGATSVSGTSTEPNGTSIEIFIDASSVGTTTVASNAWTISGLTALTASQVVTAYATASGKCISLVSNSVTVRILAIGDAYQGGIVAYILQSGDPGYDAGVQHGLIAATADQGNGYDWSNWAYRNNSVSTGTAIGTGSANTDNIITQNGVPADQYGNPDPSMPYAAYMAKACNDGGYSDWYLPSNDELAKLYINRVAIGGFQVSYSFDWYFSSSQVNSSEAWAYNFYNGNNWDLSKVSESIHVRAIRSF